MARKKRKGRPMFPNITLIFIGIAAVIMMIVILHYHFIITDDGLEVAKKITWGPKNTLVDTRDWGVLDWIKNSDVSEALSKKKLKEVIDKL